MGQIEERGKKRARKRNLKKAILSAVQIAALTGVAVTIPNLPSALYKLGLINTDRNTAVIPRARNRYLKAGLLSHDKKGFLRLTSKGELALRRMQGGNVSAVSSKRWDGRWRVLAFDVSEKRKHLRPKIREALRAVGFIRLQDSVWIYPHDCEDFIVLLKADFRIGKEMLYMIVDELESDSWVRQRFGL